MKREELLEGLLEEVREDGLRLGSIPDEFKTWPICMAAVRQNGLSLELVPDVFKTIEVCQAAVKKNWHALEFVPPEKRTLWVCSTALRKSGDITCFDLIPKQILRQSKLAAGCYNYRPPQSGIISSIYRKA
jgi:hypothetical protein